MHVEYDAPFPKCSMLLHIQYTYCIFKENILSHITISTQITGDKKKIQVINRNS